MKQMLARAVIGGVALVSSHWGNAAAAGADPDAGDRQCKAMAKVDFLGIPDASTQITEAKAIEGSGGTPAHCRVQGYVSPQVGFELRLPAVGWNGKFIHAGCGGWCGKLNSAACDSLLRRGYVCVVSDMGHKGTSIDMLWSYNNLQAQIDFGYRATHVSTVAGKAIATRFYSRAPARSYFVGCSTGGYQGLTAAQRFPWDFDGIIAGAPDIDQVAASLRVAWVIRSYLDASGRARLDTQDLQTLHRGVLAQCDGNDGVKDGIIGNPLGCQPDVRKLECRGGERKECLERSKLDVVERLYSGPRTSKGEVIVPGGYLPGSELMWNLFWPASALEQFFQYGIPGYSAGPQWKLADLDFDNDPKRFGLAAHYENSNPDLRRFRQAGGKLIVFHGTNDTVDPPAPMIDYYETVERTMGGRAATQEFFRLFMLPGVNHCAGGDGADVADFLGHLEAWVERGQAPDMIVTARLTERDKTFRSPYGGMPSDPSKVEFTRPVFPYPSWARYQGTGDSKQAKNFVPVSPASTTNADLVTHNDIAIEASPAEIWPQIVEPGAWKTGARLYSISGEKGKVGERFKAVMPDDPQKVAFYVTNIELIPQQRRTIRIGLTEDGLMGFAIWELVPQGAATLVRYDVYWQSPVATGKPNPTATEKTAAAQAWMGMNQRRFGEELATLKALLEARR